MERHAGPQQLAEGPHSSGEWPCRRALVTVDEVDPDRVHDHHHGRYTPSRRGVRRRNVQNVLPLARHARLQLAHSTLLDLDLPQRKAVRASPRETGWLAAADLLVHADRAPRAGVGGSRRALLFAAPELVCVLVRSCVRGVQSSQRVGTCSGSCTEKIIARDTTSDCWKSAQGSLFAGRARPVKLGF